MYLADRIFLVFMVSLVVPLFSRASFVLLFLVLSHPEIVPVLSPMTISLRSDNP